MDTISVRPKKEEDGSKVKPMSKKAPLTERIMKKAAVVALAVGLVASSVSCAPKQRERFENDAGSDAEMVDAADGDVVDADSDVFDGDISDGDVVDADDGGVHDGDVADGDMADGDVEEDADIVGCPGVSNSSIVSENVDIEDSAEVGGYSLTYRGQVPDSSDIYIDVHCAATGEEIETGLEVPLYGTATAEAPLDGKTIEITNHSSSDSGARISATVSDS